MTFNEIKNNLLVDNCFYLGDILKSHGNKGRFSVKLFFDLEKIEEESILVEINNLLIPFFIDFAQSSLKSNPILLKFFNVDSIDEAKSFHNRKLFLPYNSISNIEDYLIDWENFIIGFSVIETKLGNIGIIDNFIDNKHNPLFIIKNEEANHYIPINSVKIKKADYKNKIIYCELPENILDI